ncbi:MAG: hypothetical protein GXP10_00005, partial [Gammaproteobacteria bacterium]|nr:hypothetical protein [Gammaproteobacteria bacterium]
MLQGSEFIESVNRLALGVEPMDALQNRACVRALRVDIERSLPHTSRTPKRRYCFPQELGRAPQTLCRHTSGRYSLLYHPSLQEAVALRIYDYERYYVPRR